jgi:hypothetical protein
MEKLRILQIDILMKVFLVFLALFFHTFECSDICSLDSKCQSIIEFKNELDRLSISFYGNRFPRNELSAFQENILEFVRKWDLPLCLDCISEMIISRMFPLNSSTKIYLFGAILHILSGKRSLRIIKILWKNQRNAPPSSKCLKIILKELVSFLANLKENYSEFLQCSQQLDHVLYKLIKQLQYISHKEQISEGTVTLERIQFLNAMLLFKTNLTLERFLKLVGILKTMERDEFLFFYLLCHEFSFYMFAADEPDYYLIVEMMGWDDRNQSGHLLSWIFYQFLLNNLEKLNEFANLVPFYDLHLEFFKNSLEAGKLSIESADTSTIEPDILL